MTPQVCPEVEGLRNFLILWGEDVEGLIISMDHQAKRSLCEELMTRVTDLRPHTLMADVIMVLRLITHYTIVGISSGIR